MTIINENDTAIVVIDVQEKLINAVFNKELVNKNANIVINMAKILDLPLIITEQYPKGLGSTISRIKEIVNDANKYFEKTSFNALNHENISTEIKKINRKNILLFGIETHICVYQTAVALVENGYNVTIIADACGSRSEYEYKMALENFKSLGINIKTTEMVLFELLKDSKNPNFKQLQALIK